MIPLTEDFSPNSSLTPQQHRIISLLAAGNSITTAAEQEQIHRNTIAYWRRTSPAFARELEHALNEQRLYWHEQATELAPKALAAIEDALTNPDSSPSLRFRAAVLILKLATDPQAKAIPHFPTLSPELESVSGQVHALRKELFVQSPKSEQPAQNCTNAPQSPSQRPCGADFSLLRASARPTSTSDTSASSQLKPEQPAQNCTKAPQQPSRNSLCPCGSTLKYKRCCANKSAQMPQFDQGATIPLALSNG